MNRPFYDALGRRVKKETAGGTTTTTYRWDGDQLLSEYIDAPHAERKREYVFEGFAPLAMREASGDWEETYLIEADQVGTPRAAVNRDGELVWEADFSGFGEVRDEHGSARIPLRYPGQLYDGETGLSYNRFRYYDAALRCYTQPDPIGLLGGLTSHGYVHDPLSWTDALGLACQPKDTPFTQDATGRWHDKEGRFTSFKYPPNRGFERVGPRTMQQGEIIDRYGGWYDETGAFHDRGTFVSPSGVPFEQRSLPPSALKKPHKTYEVVKPFEVDSGPAAPWFGQPGGGVQHELPKSIDDLVDEGFLKRLP